MKDFGFSNYDDGDKEMKGKREGMVTRNLLSLELQLKTLFEDCGGSDSIQLLDSLSRLSKREQEIALKMFASVCDKVALRDERLISDEESKLKNFEEELFDSIVAEIYALPNRSERGSLKLQVYDGGKSDQPKVINLSEIRRSRTNCAPLETA